MDALYLKENINNAISEALTSMVVSVPDDPIEYLGTYLLNYVERNTFMSQVPTHKLFYILFLCAFLICLNCPCLYSVQKTL